MKKFFTLIAVAAMAFAAQASTLTVCDNGLYMSNVFPIYGLWVDTEGTMGQMIYPAEMLEDMVGQEITEVMFYTLDNYYESQGTTSTDPSDFINFSGATIQLSLMKVEQSTFDYSNPVVIEGATVVATVVPEEGSARMTFVLDEPYVYEGGNLLVECKVIEAGTWGSTYFWGTAGDNGYCSYYQYEGYDEFENGASEFLPKATFTYEPVEAPEYTYEGYWIVLIDKDGNEIPYQLNPGINTDYATTVALEYNIYGTFDYYGGEERPVVGYYFIVNDVKYGAPEDMTETVLGTALDNPLVEGMNYYTVPVGYNYTLGIFVQPETNEYFVYAAQGGYTGINELVNGKTVASKRYFNMAGQEMKEANGVTIVVTTYTDGTTSTAKVIK